MLAHQSEHNFTAGADTLANLHHERQRVQTMLEETDHLTFPFVYGALRERVSTLDWLIRSETCHAQPLP